MATTKKSAPAYRCTECGWTAAKWVGRCGECQAWGTVAEAGATAGPATAPRRVGTPAGPIGDVPVAASSRTPTGVAEFDRVLGGGLVAGAAVLLAGEPGVGKSTLLLEVAARAARDGRKVLYLSGEESAGQVRLRAERMSALESRLLFAAESDLGTVLGHLEQQRPDLAIVDSIQTIASADVEGAAGGVSQVREVASALVQAAKASGSPMIIVGHVTREGSIAGPRLVEHLVDVVCQFEGDAHSSLRLLRAHKNRFGSVDEVGCFQLIDRGIEEVPDPSGLFLSHASEPIAGTCVTVTIDGRRALPGEVQALVAPSALANPRRATTGVDAARVAMMLAILHRRAGLALISDDVYVATVGGARIGEPAADLALGIALASARLDRPVRKGTMALGEVTLAGAARSVAGIGVRISEAARLGFTRAIVPAAAADAARDAAAGRMEVVGVESLAEGVHAALMPSGDRQPD